MDERHIYGYIYRWSRRNWRTGKIERPKNGRPFPIPIYDQREWLKLNPPTTFNDLFGDIE